MFFFLLSFHETQKMWIYSLGRTLTETMPTSSSKSTINSAITENSIHHQQQQHHSSIVLQATIWKMCNRELEERASLMLLLNVSTFQFNIILRLK